MRILLALASTYGSTREMGEWISQELRAGGHGVHLAEVSDAGALDGYDAVVLGSAVYIGRILTPARQFARRLEHEFAPKPVWVFASGMKNVTAYPLGARFTRAVPPPYFSGQYPIFAGRIDRDQLGPAERSLVGFAGASHQDERDPDLVAAWAGEVSARMRATEPVPGSGD